MDNKSLSMAKEIKYNLTNNNSEIFDINSQNIEKTEKTFTGTNIYENSKEIKDSGN